jgi:hypothetical protein
VLTWQTFDQALFYPAVCGGCRYNGGHASRRKGLVPGSLDMIEAVAAGLASLA